MLILERLVSNDAGVFGVFIYDRKILCYTLELPWLGNIQNKSCIPTGEYAVSKCSTPRFGEAFHVKNVPFREGILIHPANWKSELRGCIAPGLDIDGAGVNDSRAAMKRLYAALPSQFNLIVKEN